MSSRKFKAGIASDIYVLQGSALFQVRTCVRSRGLGFFCIEKLQAWPPTFEPAVAVSVLCDSPQGVLQKVHIRECMWLSWETAIC